MRDLIIDRFKQMFKDPECELENPDTGEWITSIEEIEAMSDAEMLDLFEYTVGFQG